MGVAVRTLKVVYDPADAKRQTARTAAIFEGFVDAVRPLIVERLRSGGIVESIAAEFNDRGLPAWGRDRWTCGLVTFVLRQRS